MGVLTILACVNLDGASEGAPGKVADEEAAEEEGTEALGDNDSGPVDTGPEEEDDDGTVDAPDQPAAADILWGDETQAFDLTLDDDSLDALRADPGTDVPATLRWEGRTWVVGVHIKGTWSFRDLNGKASFKVDFGEYGDRDFYGVRRITLNNMIQDPTMLHEHAAYWTYAALAAPAPRHGYANVTVNGELFGLYGIVESMDQDFIDARWPDDDDGTLYETKAGAGDVTGALAEQFVVQEEGIEEPFLDIEALAAALDAGQAEGRFLEAVEARFDADVIFATLAVDIASGHDDGYTFARNNYLLYRAPVADRWYMMPWGQDQSFDRDNSPFGGGVRPVKGRLTADCVSDSACRERLELALGDAADAMGSPEFRAEMEATSARILADCEADPRRERTCQQYELMEYVERRVEQVRGWLD